MDTTDNYQRIAYAIDFLRARHPDQAGLCELAAHLGLSRRMPAPVQPMGQDQPEAFPAVPERGICQAMYGQDR